MYDYFYQIDGVNGMSFDTLKEARAYVRYCLNEKDDYQSTAIRGALGMRRDIIRRVSLSTGTVRRFELL